MPLLKMNAIYSICSIYGKTNKKVHNYTWHKCPGISIQLGDGITTASKYLCTILIFLNNTKTTNIVLLTFRTTKFQTEVNVLREHGDSAFAYVFSYHSYTGVETILPVHA